jgi:hypothetical protein
MATDIEDVIARAHPASNLFPMMGDAELWDLAEDIGKQGLLEPIVLDQGLILDGRNRWVACARAGCTPWTVPWEGEGGSATAYVIAKNLKRRHLDPSQRAAVAAEALPLFEAEAKQRQRASGGDRKSDVAMLPPPILAPHAARDEASAQFGVSPRYIQDAKRLRLDDPDAFDRVRSGEITLPQAKRESPAFVLSPPAEETPEEKGYYGLTRQRLLTRLDPDAVAAVCSDPDLSLESFEALSDWMARFCRALRERIENPIRLVQ